MLRVVTLGFLLAGGVFATDPYAVYQFEVVQNEIPLIECPQNQRTSVLLTGTLLLPRALGDLDLKCGNKTDVSGHFKHLPAPTRFGRNFLTYVLWAATPARETINLGEVMPDDMDRVTFQSHVLGSTFGLMVTAEPYFAVRTPSNAVVMEVNFPVSASIRTVTLPKRPVYQYDVFSGRVLSLNVAKPIPLQDYKLIVNQYEAESALAVAQAAGADKYANDEFSQAKALVNYAADFKKKGGSPASVIQVLHLATTAAEAARQTAEAKRAEVAQVEEEKAQLQRQQAKRAARKRKPQAASTNPPGRERPTAVASLSPEKSVAAQPKTPGQLQ